MESCCGSGPVAPQPTQPNAAAKGSLATDRIYRLMIAQRIRHRDLVKITGGDGAGVEHTLEFISRIFDEELERLIEELPADAAPAAVETLTEARRQSEGMIISGEFDPI